ncbi:MAG TPA: cupin domain-containing protein, partial [Chitinophagaceae bacterium]|nr:cupin domain-containing protein [Chitinophagaceae bacterium]
HTDGSLQVVTLGSSIEKGHHFQFVVPANCWFASRPAAESRYCFVGCTVAPGFDFADFEMAKVTELSQEYPSHLAIIETLCR